MSVANRPDPGPDAASVHISEADPPVEALTSQEVCDDTGASYRQLDHWTRQGYIRPTEIRRRNTAIRTALSADIVQTIRQDREQKIPGLATQRRLNLSKYAYYAALRDPAARTRRGTGDPSAPGSGYARGWSVAETEVIGRMVRLVGIGLAPDRAVTVARQADGASVEVAPGVLISVSGGHR